MSPGGMERKVAALPWAEPSAQHQPPVVGLLLALADRASRRARFSPYITLSASSFLPLRAHSRSNMLDGVTMGTTWISSGLRRRLNPHFMVRKKANPTSWEIVSTRCR